MLQPLRYGLVHRLCIAGIGYQRCGINMSHVPGALQNFFREQVGRLVSLGRALPHHLGNVQQ